MTVTSTHAAELIDATRQQVQNTHLGHVIGGRVTESDSEGDLSVIDPVSGDVITHIPGGDASDVDSAVVAARSASVAWRAMTPEARANLLVLAADAVDAHTAELSALESLNTGKPLSVSAAEIPLVAAVFRFMAGAARALQSPASDEYVTGYLSVLRREPVGVVGAVTPWNYPLLTASWKIAAALAMGNTMVLKPSELTPLTTLRFMELVEGILPPGVLNIVLGTGPSVGAAISRHQGIDLVSLTGSVASGQLVLSDASQSMKLTHLELGGKAPVVVFADADLANVAETIRSAGFWNAGQECGAATRILCAEEVHDELVEELREQASTIALGGPADGDAAEMGPLISDSHRQRVSSMVTRAASDGATIALGGEAPGGAGFFYEPTLITGVRRGSQMATEEVFGPVVSVEKFSGEAEAIALANDVAYGLSASVWTENLGRALRLSSALDFGTVWVNSHLVLANEMPWGGFGASGHGREMSSLSLEDFSRTKHIMMATGQA
jgi:1-pyrroline dehydrogenase